MKILLVTPWAPTPRRPRSFGFLKLLSRDHDVGLVAAAWSPSEIRALDCLSGITVHKSRESRGYGLARAGLALFAKDRSLQQAFVGSRRFRQTVARAIDDFEPDVVVFNVLRSAHLADLAQGGVVIDLDDVRSDYYKAMILTSSSRAWRLVARIEAKRMVKAEISATKQADVVTFSSPRDVQQPRNNGKGFLVRSPHGMHDGDMATHEFDTPFPIVFVGRLCYRANVEAAVWFAEQVMPTLRVEIPNAHLYLVGEKPTDQVLRLASQSVTVVGDVPDVAPYYRGAAASVVPVEMATGVQMKLIESCALGVPTVTSALSANQAGVTDGDQVLVATSPVSWVRALARLQNDPEFAKALAEAGAAWAREEYSDDSIQASLEECMQQALSRRGRIP